MSETETTETLSEPLREKYMIQQTIIVAVFGAFLYLVFEMIPMPYLAVSIIPLGLVPSLALVATIGAIRGPIAGLLSGYIGVLLANLVLNGAIVTLTLYGLAIGVLGFVVGIGTYDITNGRSLIKLSIISAIGVVFTALLSAVFGIFVEGASTIAVLALQLIPNLTLGIPSVILLTPLFARLWCWFVERFTPSAEE
ncbi:MAG: hypothetical protein KAQ65_00180 [Candidatus Thorarchaeota archaeon]|nr:hypothetical protein [Candidatus Thorarchaeota archaeon]